MCVIERGAPVAVHEAQLERYPLLIPVYDIRTIGAGGGSIASVEDGLLKVGPRSAGAEPGPIAYGRGGRQPTLTDAAIVLGYIDTARFLDGAMLLDASAARNGVAALLAGPLGTSVEQAAVGVFTVLLAKTVGAVRQITVERGRDPRTFSLLAFGGAGPLLGPLLSRELDIREVIVPVAPAAFSAWGMLSSEIVDDFSQTELRQLPAFDADMIEERFESLERWARASLAEQGIAEPDHVLERQLDLRYEGQEHSLPLPLAGSFEAEAVRRAFEAEHELRYGHVMDSPVQVLTTRVRASARPTEVELAPLATGDEPASVALMGSRTAWCFARGEAIDFAIYDRRALRAGHAVSGPAIVDEGTSTTIVMSDQSVRVDQFGQLRIAREVPV
jgi:N-methylhydantoinase A